MCATIGFPGSVLDKFRAVKAAGLAGVKAAGLAGVEPISHMNQ
jgi:hypothetical protein